MARKERTEEQRVYDEQVNQIVEKFRQSLRVALRRQGLSQREIQKRLGWGASFISQMFNGSKGLRLDAVLLMLYAAGLEPAVFFAEYFQWQGVPAPGEDAGAADGKRQRDLDQLRWTLDGVVQQLVASRLLDLEKLSEAVRTAAAMPVAPLGSGSQAAAT